jgi:hypothetical protein
LSQSHEFDSYQTEETELSFPEIGLSSRFESADSIGRLRAKMRLNAPQQAEPRHVVLPHVRVDSTVHEKLEEEQFIRISKNMTWLRVLVDLSLRAFEAGNHGCSDERKAEAKFHLTRIESAEQCFTRVLSPIVNSLYPHAYEMMEIFGKYVSVSYELAKITGTTALLTEELWEETVAEDINADSNGVSTETRLSQLLGSGNDNDINEEARIEPSEFFVIAKHLYVAARNLTANLEQLKDQFKSDGVIIQLSNLLRPRIVQIEVASSCLYRLSEATTLDRGISSMNSSASVKLEGEAQSSPAMKGASGRVPGFVKNKRVESKWNWEGNLKEKASSNREKLPLRSG